MGALPVNVALVQKFWLLCSRSLTFTKVPRGDGRRGKTLVGSALGPAEAAMSFRLPCPGSLLDLSDHIRRPLMPATSSSSRSCEIVELQVFSVQEAYSAVFSW